MKNVDYRKNSEWYPGSWDIVIKTIISHSTSIGSGVYRGLREDANPAPGIGIFFLSSFFTDKKEFKIFLIYKEIQKGSVAVMYMTNGLLFWLNISAFPHILWSPSSYSIWLCNSSHLNFLIDEENFVFVFIDVPCFEKTAKSTWSKWLFREKFIRWIFKTLVKRKFFSTSCPSTRKRDPSRYVQEIIRGNLLQSVQIVAIRCFSVFTFIFKKVLRISIAEHRHQGWCRRHRHSSIRYLSPVPDGVPLFRYRTGSGNCILSHSGTRLTGCRTVGHSGTY